MHESPQAANLHEFAQVMGKKAKTIDVSPDLVYTAIVRRANDPR